jgi:hypothetical protein
MACFCHSRVLLPGRVSCCSASPWAVTFIDQDRIGNKQVVDVSCERKIDVSPSDSGYHILLS